MSKWYVGHIRGTRHLEAFTSEKTPTPKDFPTYAAVVGPFKTRRGAVWAEKYGYNNPHFQHVNDAERIAKHG